MAHSRIKILLSLAATALATVPLALLSPSASAQSVDSSFSDLESSAEAEPPKSRSLRAPSSSIKRQAEVDSEVAEIMQMLRDEGIDIDGRMARAGVLCRNRVLSEKAEISEAEIEDAVKECTLTEEGIVYARAINEMNATRANAFDNAMDEYNADVAEAARQKQAYEDEIRRHNAEVAEVQRKQEQYRRELAAHNKLLAEMGQAPAASLPAPPASTSATRPVLAQNTATEAPPAQTSVQSPVQAPPARVAQVEEKQPGEPPAARTQPSSRPTVAANTDPPPPVQVARNQPVQTLPAPAETRTDPAEASTGRARAVGARPTYGKRLSGGASSRSQEEIELAIREATGPRIALIIGNERYDGQMGELSNPVNDAILIGTTLRSLGFDVEIVRDGSQREMKEAVRRLGDRLQEAGDNATGLFYYAGHGVQSGGQNFLIPVGSVIDSESDLELEAVKADAILAQMEEAYVSTRIVILDACRNMPLRRRSRSGARGLARMETPNGSFVAYSTSPGSTAADGGGINSPFAESLSEQMLVPDRPIEVTFREVRREVVELTNGDQVPWNSSSLLDTFTFARAR